MQSQQQKTVTLLLGGARSGKSRYAQQLGERAERVVFVATAQAADEEMRDKIERHRRERPRHWPTIEEPIALAETIGRYGPGCELMIVDCLTLFAANLLQAENGSANADRYSTRPCTQPLEDLCAALASPPCSVVLVSNEAGSGVVPPYQSGRLFRDLLGEMNQRVACIAANVLLLVAGLPLVLKGQVER